MKKIIFILLLLIPMSIVYADGITISTSDISLKEGETSTFNISASSCAGRVDIYSSNNQIVELSSSKEFLDNNTISVKVTAKKEGNANITIKLTDVSSYSEKAILGSKIINVKVQKNDSSVLDLSQEQPEITKFEIVGYNIDFDIDKYDYTINVLDNVEELYILVEGSNISSKGTGNINIDGKNQIQVEVTSQTGTKIYNININRDIKSKEPQNKSNYLLYILIFFGMIIIIIISIVIIFRKDKKEM